MFRNFLIPQYARLDNKIPINLADPNAQSVEIYGIEQTSFDTLIIESKKNIRYLQNLNRILFKLKETFLKCSCNPDHIT